MIANEKCRQHNLPPASPTPLQMSCLIIRYNSQNTVRILVNSKQIFALLKPKILTNRESPVIGGDSACPPNRPALCDCVVVPSFELSLRGMPWRRGRRHYMPYPPSALRRILRGFNKAQIFGRGKNDGEIQFHGKNQFCFVPRINRTTPIIPTIHATGRAIVGNSGAGIAHTVLEKVVVTVFDISDFSHLDPVFTLLTHVSAVFVADIRPGIAGLTLKLIFRQECHGTFVEVPGKCVRGYIKSADRRWRPVP